MFMNFEEERFLILPKVTVLIPLFHLLKFPKLFFYFILIEEMIISIVVFLMKYSYQNFEERFLI